MKVSEPRSAMQVTRQVCRVLAASIISVASAGGQRYEITPLAGGMFGGTLPLEQRAVTPNFDARVQNSFSYGIAGGFRFADDIDGCEGCNLFEFRWLRQRTHLALRQDPLAITPVTIPSFHPGVTLDRFLGDFTHEFTVNDAKMIKPFLTASLGAARMSTPAASATRFAFGIGTGIKIIPKRHWGIRFEIEYLPILRHAELQRVVCAVNCVFVLNGGIMNQIELSAGPAFRF